MYTAQGDFVCQEKKNTIENFGAGSGSGSGYITAPLPDGSYIDSCKNCRYTASKSGPSTLNNLKCDCLKNDSKTYKSSTLTNCSKDIVNNNGNLKCGYNDK
jgi:hypothetical protein